MAFVCCENMELESRTVKDSNLMRDEEDEVSGQEVQDQIYREENPSKVTNRFWFTR